MKMNHDIRIDRSFLHPKLNYKLTKLLNECEKKGIYLIITEGFRTVARQEELYAQGRTKPGNIVTNARGTSYSSQHMWGVAFDIAINDSKLLYDITTIKKVAAIAKSPKVGLAWGGDWKSFPDTPHFYINGWGSTTSILKQKYGNPDTFKKTWKKTVSKKDGVKVWKRKTKIGGIWKKLSYGKSVKVIATKGWYCKVLLGSDKAGYVNKKYLM